jgi:hypothetical protein
MFTDTKREFTFKYPPNWSYQKSTEKENLFDFYETNNEMQKVVTVANPHIVYSDLYDQKVYASYKEPYIDYHDSIRPDSGDNTTVACFRYYYLDTPMCLPIIVRDRYHPEIDRFLSTFRLSYH